MNKKLVSIVALGAIGLGSALGINYLSNVEAQEKKFYERKEQISTNEFRYFLNNKVVADVGYTEEGNFILSGGNISDNIYYSTYNKKKNLSSLDFRIKRDGGRTDMYRAYDKNDDNSIEEIRLQSFMGLRPNPNKHPEIFKKAKEYFKIIKEKVKWEDLKKEAARFKFPEAYKKIWEKEEALFEEFDKARNK